MKEATLLTELVRRNFDAEKGFTHAANKTENTVLTRYFMRNAQMHGRFAFELNEDLKRLGREATNESTLQGELHRAWMSVKSEITSNTDEALLEECERGQEVAMKDYQDAVIETTDTSLASKLAAHKAEIVDVVQELKELEVTS